MKVLRTPEPRFINLPGYPFEPNYVELGDVRMHYVDEGPRTAPPIVMLHGEPSWSYLYRKMIPPIAAAGYRALAPDLIGFGKSDKPAARSDYTYERHLHWLSRWLIALNLSNVTLVCQDWGGFLGLRLVAAYPDLFARVVAANTTLPTGQTPPPAAFRIWQTASQLSPWFPVARIVNLGCATKLSPEVMAAYDAPFPDNSYKAGAREFPKLVPTKPSDPNATANKNAWGVLSRWNKPFLTAFSSGDPIMRGLDKTFQKRIPGAEDQPHTTIRGAGHFLQEDKGEELAEVVLQFIDQTED